jgi:hypothetical protein
MADSEEQYRKAREEFDRLSVEDQTAFLVESAFRVFGSAVEKGGAGMADMIHEMAERARSARKRKERGEDSGEGASAKSASSSSDDDGEGNARPHDRVDGRIPAFGPVQMSLQHLDSRDLARPNTAGQPNGGAGRIIGHGARRERAVNNEHLLVRRGPAARFGGETRRPKWAQNKAPRDPVRLRPGPLGAPPL